MTVMLFDITSAQHNISIVKTFYTDKELIDYASSMHGLEFELENETIDAFKNRIVADSISSGSDCRCAFFDTVDEARVFAWVFKLTFPSSKLLKAFISNMRSEDGSYTRCKLSDILSFLKVYKGLYAEEINERWNELYPSEETSNVIN
jgi:hypothetical protein